MPQTSVYNVMDPIAFSQLLCKLLLQIRCRFDWL